VPGALVTGNATSLQIDKILVPELAQCLNPIQEVKVAFGCAVLKLLHCDNAAIVQHALVNMP